MHYPNTLSPWYMQHAVSSYFSDINKLAKKNIEKVRCRTYSHEVTITL